MVDFNIYNAIDIDKPNLSMFNRSDHADILITKLIEPDLSKLIFDHLSPEMVLISAASSFEKRHFFDGADLDDSFLNYLPIAENGQIVSDLLSKIDVSKRTLISIELSCPFTGVIFSPKDFIDATTANENLFLHINAADAVDNIDLAPIKGADLITLNKRPQNQIINAKIADEQRHFETAILAGIKDCQIVADNLDRLPNISCLIINGVNGEILSQMLKQNGISSLSGSACGMPDREIPPIFTALGYSFIESSSSLTLDLSTFNNNTKIDELAAEISEIVKRLRKISGYKIGV